MTDDPWSKAFDDMDNDPEAQARQERREKLDSDIVQLINAIEIPDYPLNIVAVAAQFIEENSKLLSSKETIPVLHGILFRAHYKVREVGWWGLKAINMNDTDELHRRYAVHKNLNIRFGVLKEVFRQLEDDNWDLGQTNEKNALEGLMQITEEANEAELKDDYDDKIE